MRPSVALVGLGVGRGLYDDASPKFVRAVVRDGPVTHDVPSIVFAAVQPVVSGVSVAWALL